MQASGSRQSPFESLNQRWPFSLLSSLNYSVLMGTADYWAAKSDDRVDTMYLANRHELLAYGRIMKRKSENVSSIKRHLMTFTRKLHGKLKAVNLSFKTFELPRIRILFKCDRSKYHRSKERMTSRGGKNEGRNRCDLDGHNFLYHRLRPYRSNDEDDSWGGIPSTTSTLQLSFDVERDTKEKESFNCKKC